MIQQFQISFNKFKIMAKKSNKNWLWFLGVVVLWLVSYFVINYMCGNADGPGTFGDQFGAINALFTGLSFAAIIITLRLQQQELNAQRREFMTSRAMTIVYKQVELVVSVINNSWYNDYHLGLKAWTYVEDELGIDVTAERIALLKTLDRLNKFTHVNEDSFDSSQEDVERHASAACEALQSFLDCAAEARKLLCGRVEQRVHDDVVGEAIGDTILSLDEIATHHCINDVDVDQIEVTSMDHAEIQFTAYGSVGVQLQWGSNSDVRRGDGAVIQDSYPLTCRFISEVDNPEELEVVQDSLCVDTSSWWDDYYDEGEPS